MAEKKARAQLTALLQQVNSGREDALEQLMPAVYGELRRQAARCCAGGNGRSPLLPPTALVNEAFIKLIDQRNVRWQNRAHFFGIAAQAMRRIMVDHARTRQRVKRGGVQHAVTLDEAMIAGEPRTIDVLALDEALTRLAALDERQAQIVELRYFAELSVEETAQVTGLSPATVKRDGGEQGLAARRIDEVAQAAPARSLRSRRTTSPGVHPSRAMRVHAAGRLSFNRVPGRSAGVSRVRGDRRVYGQGAKR